MSGAILRAPRAPEPWVEYKTRLAGEAAYLAGECCTLATCEARCGEAFDIATRYPARNFQIFAAFARGFNEMGDCLARNGFALSDVRTAA